MKKLSKSSLNLKITKSFEKESELIDYIYPFFTKLFERTTAHVYKEHEITPHKGYESLRSDIVVKDKKNRVIFIAEVKLSKSLNNEKYKDKNHLKAKNQLVKYYQSARCQYGAIVTESSFHLYSIDTRRKDYLKEIDSVSLKWLFFTRNIELLLTITIVFIFIFGLAGYFLGTVLVDILNLL